MHEYFTGKYTTPKIHAKLHPGLEWRIFHILTSEDIDDFTDMKFAFKLYLNSLVYDRNIFGSSSKVFANLRKFSENIRERSSDLRNFRKSLKNRQKSSSYRESFLKDKLTKFPFLTRAL